MNKRVLVTGGNGFIGSVLLRKLIEEHYTPIVIKRNASDMWRLSDITDYLKIVNIENVTIEKIFKRDEIDAVINLATYYKKFDSFENIEKMIDSNIKFPTLLLQLCKEHNVPTFLTAGTYFQFKTNSGYLGYTNSKLARDLYAATKNALENIMEYYSSVANTKTVELILFTPYGEKDHKEKLIPYIIRQALEKKPINLTQGFQKLNLVYVEDVATAFINALNTENFGRNLVVNIANKKSYSIREIVGIIGELLESYVDVRYNSIIASEIDRDYELIVDTSRALEYLKWKPKFDIYEGLMKTINYYRGVK